MLWKAENCSICFNFWKKKLSLQKLGRTVVCHIVRNHFLRISKKIPKFHSFLSIYWNSFVTLSLNNLTTVQGGFKASKITMWIQDCVLEAALEPAVLLAGVVDPVVISTGNTSAYHLDNHGHLDHFDIDTLNYNEIPAITDIPDINNIPVVSNIPVSSAASAVVADSVYHSHSHNPHGIFHDEAGMFSTNQQQQHHLIYAASTNHQQPSRFQPRGMGAFV